MSVRPKRKAVKKTNKGLATIRVASHTETVPLMPPGPAWKHGDLGPSNITVVEHVNPKATDHQTVTRDGVSDIEQEWYLERSKQEKEGNKRQRLENKMAFGIERANQEKLQLERHNLERKTGGETERAKQEQKRIELQNLENEKMRELEKTRQEIEELASRQRLSKMDKELQELRDQVSKLKIQQHSPLPLTTVHAPTSSKPDSSSHQRVSHIPSDRQSFGHSVQENSGPHIERPYYFQPEVSRFGTSAQGYGETPPAAPIPLSQILHQNDPLLKHIGIGELRREEEFIALKLEFFEDFCLERRVESDHDRYKLLDKLVAWGDKQDYRNRFDRNNQNYLTLKKFLIGGEGRLSHVLFQRAEKHSVSGQELDVEIGKFMAELRDVATLKKFVTIHLAPPRLRGKIREKLHLDVKKFDLAVRTIVDTSNQDTKTRAMNVNYTNQGAATNRNNTRPNQIHPNRPPINNYRNPNQGFLCHKHLNFGERAHYCADTERCSMRHMVIGYHPKNGHPNSPQ